jgi:hypothetical protein
MVERPKVPPMRAGVPLTRAAGHGTLEERGQAGGNGIGRMGDPMRAHVGDWLLVGHGRQRTGLIIGLLRGDGQPPYIVRWLSTGHIAMVFPDQYARIVPPGYPAGSALQPD